MKKSFLAISIILPIIAACSSGGDSSTAPLQTEHNWVPGIYNGAFTPAGQPVESVALLVTSNNNFMLANIDGTEIAIGTVSGSNLTTPDGITITLDSTLSGTYTVPGVVTGTFTLTDANLYNRTSNTAKLEGVWVDDFYTQSTGTTTWVIDATGNILMTSISGCSATGKASTIDPSKNEYSVSATVSNCPGYDGVYSGFGFTDDTSFIDDTFGFGVFNPILQTFGIYAPVKQ